MSVIHQHSIAIGARISNYIHINLCDVIIHTYDPIS